MWKIGRIVSRRLVVALLAAVEKTSSGETSIVLDERGPTCTSVQFAERLFDGLEAGGSRLSFFIGGAGFYACPTLLCFELYFLENQARKKIENCDSRRCLLVLLYALYHFESHVCISPRCTSVFVA